MNRYSAWKYAVILFALVVGTLYTAPNFYGDDMAVQVSAKANAEVNQLTLEKVRAALGAAKLDAGRVALEGVSIKARFASSEAQRDAKAAIEKALNPNPDEPAYVVALNSLTRAPAWLSSVFRAQGMVLGLDLRGGVHFMLQVDMPGAVTKRLDSLAGDIKTGLREKGIRSNGVSRDGKTLELRFKDAADGNAASALLQDQFGDLQSSSGTEGTDVKLSASFKPEALKRLQDQIMKQTITTLHNRINELAVSEPVIQQQGADRIVVQLPGVQDTAQAKKILGSVATLELRLVDESTEANAALTGGAVPFGSERYLERTGVPVIVKKQIIISGENLTDAQAGFDSQTQQPKVDLVVDSKGGRIMRDVSRENIKKRMAIILFEKGKGEVLTAPVIQSELGNRFQISGHMSVVEAGNLALLLRAGALPAAIDIIEERTIGPSLGAENIAKGVNSVTWGFVAVAVFMCVYYMLFGIFSSLALGLNLLLLVAVLSMLQATLTLPGMAAMALVLGMAIDANVLINERIREELRNGVSPQAAIHAGYDRAWATIFDSNVTTLIAGLALLAFGSGPVKGFATVHVLGITTSMFSGVFFSRGLVNLWYGQQKKLKTVSIGTVWRAPGSALVDKQS